MTKIQWTNRTWNPTRGCSIVSPGCAHCYAMHQAHRMNHPGGAYEGLTKMTPTGPKWTGGIRLVPEKLDEPLHWRQPSRVFVDSMSDLFHEDVPPVYIRMVFDRMQRAAQHTFQILTKRPARMLDMIIDNSMFSEFESHPLPNVWLGISCEDQATANERIPLLLQAPAAVRFLSCEPLLGPIDLSFWLDANAVVRNLDNSEAVPPVTCDSLLHWVIVGGESGPGARSMDVAWARAIVEQCRAAGTAVFVKQLGAKPVEGHEPTGEFRTNPATGRRQYAYRANPLAFCDSKGGDPEEWPEDLRVREFPADGPADQRSGVGS